MLLVVAGVRGWIRCLAHNLLFQNVAPSNRKHSALRSDEDKEQRSHIMWFCITAQQKDEYLA
jgi:hypothetical protein